MYALEHGARCEPAAERLARIGGQRLKTLNVILELAAEPDHLEALDLGGHALQGKDLWLVATTGGTEEAYHPSGYNRYFFDAFLPPSEQTAALCGMRFLPPMVLHGAHRATEPEVAEQAARYARQLASYPDWPELEDLDACPACEVPSTDRPSAP